MNSTTRETTLRCIRRYLAYGLFTALLMQSLVFAVSSGLVVDLGPESGPVEAVHMLLLAGSVVFFARAAAVDNPCASAFTLAWCAALLGLVRESDGYLDHAFFKGAYKLPAALIGVATLVWIWRARRNLRGAIAHWTTTPSFFFAAVGGFVVLVYAQIVGQKEFWQAIMGPGYARPVKDAVEELMELLGYLLIFFGSLEAYSSARCSAASETADAKRAETNTEPGSS
jgi:hypothetical protein